MHFLCTDDEGFDEEIEEYVLQLLMEECVVDFDEQNNQTIDEKPMSYHKPEDCHSPKAYWSLLTVLENRGPKDISLAVGRWDGVPCLAMRWNGSDDPNESPVGNPQSRGIPTWFILPKDYAEKILVLLPLAKQNLAREFIPEPK